jgi:hypothetical protein
MAAGAVATSLVVEGSWATIGSLASAGEVVGSTKVADERRLAIEIATGSKIAG